MNPRQDHKHLILDADLTIFSEHGYKAIENTIFSIKENHEKFGELRGKLDSFKRTAASYYRAAIKAEAEHLTLQQQLDSNKPTDFMLKMLLEKGDNELAAKHVQQKKEEAEEKFKKHVAMVEKINEQKQTPLYKEFVALQWETLKNVPVYGSAEQWKNIMEAFAKQDWKITIASFTSYDDALERYIREIIKPECNITVIGYLPSNPDYADKNNHILETTGTACKKEDILFVDDSKRNISKANESGCRTILADGKATHVDKLASLCENMNKLDEIAPHKNTVRKRSALEQTYAELPFATLFGSSSEEITDNTKQVTPSSPRLGSDNEK